MSTPRQKALAKHFHEKDYSVVCHPRLLSPGRVAIIAKQPWVFKRLPIPALNRSWRMSRVIVARALYPGMRELILFSVYGWDLPGHLQSPKPRNPKKSPKKSPERSLGPPGTPKKVPKKVRKVQKIVDFNYFLDFSDFFGNLLGVPGGPRDLSGDFFGDFLGFRGFGLCRWPGRSQVYGFLESHKNRCVNEDMVLDVFTAMANLTMPTIFAKVVICHMSGVSYPISVRSPGHCVDLTQRDAYNYKQDKGDKPRYADGPRLCQQKSNRYASKI